MLSWITKQAPWILIFADNIVLCSENKDKAESDLERWWHVLERRGMKMSRSKTEYLCFNEQEGNDHIKLEGNKINKF
jgi:hypothetical protein